MLLTPNWPEIACGSSGNNVKSLQYLLNYRGSSLNVDGLFGQHTKMAVVVFQQQSGVAIDGIAGENTLSCLIDDIIHQQNSLLVKGAQILLKKFENVVVDGVFGPDSKQSTESFQRRMKIKVTGSIDKNTWRYLFGYDAYPINVETGNTTYHVSTILNAEQEKLLLGNSCFYQEAAEKYDLPWQIIASIHYREYGLRRAGPSNGNGPYQIWGRYYKVGAYSDSQFMEATYDCSEFVRKKVGNIDMTIDANVKLAFFRYNGVAKAYIEQARKLGFSEDDANIGEGSPYVMNRFDIMRDPTQEPTKSNGTWGQIKADGGRLIFPANPDYGAFVLYKALV